MRAAAAAMAMITLFTFQALAQCNPPCSDNVPCTIDSCINGQCYYPYACNDNNPCTTDQCIIRAGNRVCRYTAIACNDNNPCTTDHCSTTTQAPFYICVNQLIDCNDTNNCTTDSCINGICSNLHIDCNDNFIPTFDYCDNTGQCHHDTSCCYIAPTPQNLIRRARAVHWLNHYHIIVDVQDRLNWIDYYNFLKKLRWTAPKNNQRNLATRQATNN